MCSALNPAARLAAGYEDTSAKLVQALREAIEMDLSDASEREACTLT